MHNQDEYFTIVIIQMVTIHHILRMFMFLRYFSEKPPTPREQTRMQHKQHMEFNSRDEVIAWIIETQRQRRNLNQLQLSYYRGMSYELEKRLVGNRSGKNQHNVELAQNEHIPETEHMNTAEAAKRSRTLRTCNRGKVNLQK